MNFLKTTMIDIGKRMPARIRKSLFHFAFNCARDEFDKFAHEHAGAPAQLPLLKKISDKGFTPKTIVDVGGHVGDWTKLANSIWPDASILIFEPNHTKTDQLQVLANTINATLFTELLGAEDGLVVEFNVMESGSSVFAERSSTPRYLESRKVVTLDKALKNHGHIDFLKIDAQGYELEILKGATVKLKNIKAVLLEISLIEINMGCPILHEVIDHMHKAGFVAYDILEMHRRPLDRALCQIDIFFCRRNSELRSDTRFLA